MIFFPPPIIVGTKKSHNTDKRQKLHIDQVFSPVLFCVRAHLGGGIKKKKKAANDNTRRSAL